MTKVKVLFVCLGNICRSPLAEAIFKHKVTRRGYESHIEIDSCGTSNYHIGDTPDDRTIENALRNGIVINHLGRQLQHEDLEYYDFILAMDRSNHQNILRLDHTNQHHHKVFLMRSFNADDTHDEVPDPYYGGPRGFQQVFEILDRATDSFLQHLTKNFLLNKK
ncbi:MAG: low molecular weight phosphotyrosine protein phosphatase [Cyclobacteriaceae bacterium]|nr:low molecular weight phosphotyrosine protein phosphatase [Cyclobacteriaceae bacterium]